MDRKTSTRKFTPLYIISTVAILIGAASCRISESAAFTPPSSTEPLDDFCFVAPESELLTAALGFEYIEDDLGVDPGNKFMISGFGFGTVTTEQGESWGFLRSYEGLREGDQLILEEYTMVDGDTQQRHVEWTINGAFLETGEVTYSQYDCAPIEKEYLSLITGN